MANLVSIPFHGDTMEAAQDERGVWVSIRRVCQALGIDVESQRKKLRSKPWAICAVFNTVQPGDDQARDVSMLHLDSLPMWLATIEPARVHEVARGRLTAFQTEAARVLRDHFIPQVAAAPPPPPPSHVQPIAMGDERKAELLMEAARLMSADVPVLAKDVMRAHAVALLTGSEVTRFLPALPAGIWRRPAEIAGQLGCSMQRVGLAITALDLRGDPVHCRTHLDKKAHGAPGEVTVYSYDEWAFQQIRAYIAGGPAAVGGE